MPPVYEPSPGPDPLLAQREVERAERVERADAVAGPRIEDVLDRFRTRLDAAVWPIEHADETIDDVVALTNYLALPGKRKVAARRLVAEAGKVVAGQRASLASLGLDADLLEAATERFAALSALAAALRTAEATQDGLRAELAKTTAAASQAVTRMTARARATQRDPRAGADEKEAADERLRVVETMVADLPEWERRLGALDRAKEIRTRLDRAFR
jgi:hypothetical protein